MQILNLFNPLTYKREDYDFNSLLIKMLKAEKGSDSFILYSISFDDSFYCGTHAFILYKPQHFRQHVGKAGYPAQIFIP